MNLDIQLRRFLSKRNPNCKIWRILILSILKKKMIKHVAVQSFHKKIIHDVISHLNRSQEQEMGLYQQRYCQFRPKGIEKVLHKGRLSGSAKILQNRTIELSSCFYRIEQQSYPAVGMHLPSRKGKNDPEVDSDHQDCHSHQTRACCLRKKGFSSLVSEGGDTCLASVGQTSSAQCLGSRSKGYTTKKKPRGERALPRARGQGSHLESWSGATPSMHLVTKAWSQGRLFASFKI